MPTIELAGQDIEYEVRHSDRATQARIDAGVDEITVVIPDGQELDPAELLQNKQDWVLDKKEKYDRYREKIPERSFTEGSDFPYQATPHTIEVRDADQAEIVDEAIILRKDRVENESIRDRIEALYRRKARAHVEEIIPRYIDQIDGDYDQIYIRDQKTRWGSCSDRGNLSFNWRLVMAPEQVLEYVVVHELVHIEHSDHDDAFWSRLEDVYPEYETGMTWLKKNNHELA